MLVAATGGQRAADCVLEIEVCYRNDNGFAPSSLFTAWSHPDPFVSGIRRWAASLSNGWCQYLRLTNVTQTLSYSFSNDGFTWTPSGTVSVPVVTACTAALTPPTISPLGGVYNGAVVVSITTTAAGAASFYTLSGAQYTAGAVAYSGPFTLSVPGNTTVTAYSVRAGSINSASIASSFVVQLSAHPSVTSRGCRRIRGQGGGECTRVA